MAYDELREQRSVTSVTISFDEIANSRANRFAT